MADLAPPWAHLDEALVDLLESRRLFKNVRWQDYTPDGQADREDTLSLTDAEAASSLRQWGFDDHAILFDIDVPAELHTGGLFVAGDFTWFAPMGARSWLVPSSTPGHSHLYVDCSLRQWEMFDALEAFTRAGVVEKGYHQVSVKRGFTALRLPWVRKQEVAA